MGMGIGMGDEETEGGRRRSGVGTEGRRRRRLQCYNL